MFRFCCSLLVVLSLVTTASAADHNVERPTFAIEVMSVLSKAGCNAGTCHGNLNGKGGFKLSLRGQNPDQDYHALVRASRGRRVDLVSPGRSLLLLKATGATPHRGGVRLTADSPQYRVLYNWLADQAPPPARDTATVTRLAVEPSAATVAAPQHQFAVSVRAFFSDGTSRDVTRRACYELSNLNATVDADGQVTRTRYGETTLIVRYLGRQVAVPIAFIPAPPEFVWNGADERNEIDRHVHQKLKRLRINPAATCSDTVFVRRAFLDANGRIPTVAETQAFLSDARPHKRERLIDHLLSRPEFADYWSLKWADVLRVEDKVLDVQGIRVFHRWIRESIAAGKPHDQFVRELVTGLGSTFEHPPANYYRANRDPTARGETTARLFLGVRLQCARCHNHPFDRWTQDDYYRWANCFSQIDYEIGENKRADKLDKNEFAGEQQVVATAGDELKNPDTGEVVSPATLGGPALRDSAPAARLALLSEWLTAPDNLLFVQSQTNFIWYHLMGVGLVDPVDDFRLTNPASHPELLAQLATEFAASGFDLRFLVRRIMNSSAYQRASAVGSEGWDDTTLYARTRVRRLPAEVVLDMQSDVLAIPAEFVGYEPPIRAVQLPGPRTKLFRKQGLRSGDRFLKAFGKPERILACDCERSNETTLKQALVLLGSELDQRLSAPGNRIHRLTAADFSDSQIVDRLYWTALCRPPSDSELAAAVAMIEPDNRIAAIEDITWTLLNAKEFLFRH